MALVGRATIVAGHGRRHSVHVWCAEAHDVRTPFGNRMHHLARENRFLVAHLKAFDVRPEYRKNIEYLRPIWMDDHFGVRASRGKRLFGQPIEASAGSGNRHTIADIQHILLEYLPQAVVVQCVQRALDGLAHVARPVDRHGAIAELQLIEWPQLVRCGRPP